MFNSAAVYDGHGGTPATCKTAGSNVMMAASATVPAGGEFGKPGSPTYHGHDGTPATSMAAGSNLSSVTTATTAMIPAGGECGKLGSHTSYGPAMIFFISWAAQYNEGPAAMAVS